MLAAVLREVKELHGAPGVEQIFSRIGARAVERAKSKVTAKDAEGKVAQLTQVLRDQGVVAEYSLVDGGFLLQEHTCPYSGVVQEHPEVCAVIHQVIDQTLGGEHEQVDSLASGGKSCSFALKGVQVS
jgi:predicted ArsR family transcriptional regulator